MEHTSQLLENYLSRFKVHTPKSLFEPTAWDLTFWLTKGKCPYCQHKLYIDRKGNGRCKSKRRDKYFITVQKLKKYIKS